MEMHRILNSNHGTHITRVDDVIIFLVQVIVAKRLGSIFKSDHKKLSKKVFTFSFGLLSFFSLFLTFKISKSRTVLAIHLSSIMNSQTRKLSNQILYFAT